MTNYREDERVSMMANYSQEEMARYVDMEAGLARLRGNQKLYNRMLKLFLAATEFPAFEENLAQGDLAKAADVAHAIKGITGNLSLTLLFELSTRLMHELREGKCDEAVIAEYRDAYKKTVEIATDIVNSEGA